jgi:hypothetical protein
VLQNHFSLMIAPFNRAKYPDPEERYARIAKLGKAHGQGKFSTRYHVLVLTLTHLDALLVDDDPKKVPGLGIVPTPAPKAAKAATGVAGSSR